MRQPWSGDEALPDEPHGLVFVTPEKPTKCESLTEWLLEGLGSLRPPLQPVLQVYFFLLRSPLSRLGHSAATVFPLILPPGPGTAAIHCRPATASSSYLQLGRLCYITILAWSFVTGWYSASYAPAVNLTYPFSMGRSRCSRCRAAVPSSRRVQTSQAAGGGNRFGPMWWAVLRSQCHAQWASLGMPAASWN